MKNKKIPQWIIALILVLPGILSEFRFCHKGPQRLTELDCPGGFVAPEKLNITCKYYARTKNVSTITANFTGSLCDWDETMVNLDVLSHDQDDLSKIGESIQYVAFEMDDSILDNDNGGKFEPEDVCTTSCLEEWVDPAIFEDEAFIDNGRTPSSEDIDTQIEALMLNKEVFLYLFDDDDDDEELAKDIQLKQVYIPKRRPKRDILTNDIDDGDTLRVVKLLAKSMRVAIAGCSPFLDGEFFRQVLKSVAYIASKNESAILDVTPEEYKGINAVLNQCLQKRNLGFFLNGTYCDGRGKVEGIYYFRSNQYWPHRLTGYSARWGRHNPYIEAAWNALEFVHGYCFESFVDNIMDLHTYEMSVEGLFTSMILKHWEIPVKLKQDYFWNNVMFTYDIKQTMRNLDACVVAGTKMSPFKKRLERPYVGQEASENPKPDTNWQEEKEEIKKGWTKSIDEYWTWYESRGGFRELSKNFGVCVNNEEPATNKEEFREVFEEFDTVCPHAGSPAPYNPTPAPMEF